jgi:SOS response regulatory protein OraA/RecX
MAFQLALKRGLERLSRSETLEAELRGSLTRNGFLPETVEKVLAVLRDRRLINDTKTINNLVEQRTGKRAMGIEKMRFDLVAKGAPEDLVEQRLAVVTPESQRKGMLTLLKAKCKPGDARAKGSRLLLSRGFEEDAIGTVLDEFFGSADFPD